MAGNNYAGGSELGDKFGNFVQHEFHIGVVHLLHLLAVVPGPGDFVIKIMLVGCEVNDGEGAGGLGFLLNIARRRSATEYTVIIILTIPLVAWMIDQFLYVVQCWLFQWKYGKEAERSLSFRLSRWALGFFWKPARKAAVSTSEG